MQTYRPHMQTYRPHAPDDYHIRVNPTTLIDLSRPDASLIDIKDISRSLSRQVRFCGHSEEDVEPISISEHSVTVSMIAKELAEDLAFPPLETLLVAMGGLFHDGHEYLVGDNTSPLKRLIGIDIVRPIENKIDTAVASAVGINPTYFKHPLVKEADGEAYEAERDYLFCGGFNEAETLYRLASSRPYSSGYTFGIIPLAGRIGLSAKDSDKLFMKHYNYLVSEVVKLRDKEY